MVPELRPRGIGEMLDVAVAIYRASARRLVLVALVVEVPVQLLMTIVLLSAQPQSFNVNIAGSASPTTSSSGSSPGFGGWCVRVGCGGWRRGTSTSRARRCPRSLMSRRMGVQRANL